jgi:hypothetical protein
MTTLARLRLRDDACERPFGSTPDGASMLIARLREECDRQVPFSHAKLLLREAASTIERLYAEVARMTAERAERPGTGQAP